MPVFKRHLSVEIARRARAFLKLEAGVTRAGSGAGAAGGTADENAEEVRRLLAGKDREISRLRAQLSRARPDGHGAGTGGAGVDPENVVWIFGDGRSGTTWLASMMEELPGHAVWREPNVGFLFGHLYYVFAHEGQREAQHFILGRQKESWLNSIRNFFLDEANARFPTLTGDDYLVVKEPNGSIGAPLMMQALPESRMVFLVRDPRDVVASALDAHKVGGWSHKRRGAREPGDGTKPLAEKAPDSYVERRAGMYLRNVGNSKEAYEAHPGPKVLVYYEKLRADPSGEMARLYERLGIPFKEGELARAVEKHAWERVPEAQKGEGKFHRKASPGGWREDLTPEQAEAVERITAPLLKELYPG